MKRNVPRWTPRLSRGSAPRGSTLLNAGERSEAIYLIGQGFVSLTTSSGQGLATLGPGSILGEASLLAATPMDVSAKALADLSYWKLTDQALRKLILQRPSIGIQLSKNFGRLVVQMEDYLAQRLVRYAGVGDTSAADGAGDCQAIGAGGRLRRFRCLPRRRHAGWSVFAGERSG